MNSGEMAEKINEMLDGLETMNRQIVEGERKYLELDYAKKQTEMIAYKGQINPSFYVQYAGVHPGDGALSRRKRKSPS